MSMSVSRNAHNFYGNSEVVHAPFFILRKTLCYLIYFLLLSLGYVSHVDLKKMIMLLCSI